MKNKRSARGLSQDRSKVAGGQEYEVGYFMRKCNCSREEVLNAIEKVGNNRALLMQELSKGNSGSPR